MKNKNITTTVSAKFIQWCRFWSVFENFMLKILVKYENCHCKSYFFFNLRGFLMHVESSVLFSSYVLMKMKFDCNWSIWYHMIFVWLTELLGLPYVELYRAQASHITHILLFGWSVATVKASNKMLTILLWAMLSMGCLLSTY